MSDDPHFDDMDDLRDTRLAILILAIVAGAAILGCCVGCTHTQPTPEEVIPCTPVLVYPPEIPLTPHPALTSAGWTRDQVLSSPASFAESLARDLANWIGWGLGMEADIEASNEARPNKGE